MRVVYSSGDANWKARLEDEFYDVLELREPQKVAEAGILAEIPDAVEQLMDPARLSEEPVTYIPIYQMNRGMVYNKGVFQELGIWGNFLFDNYMLDQDQQIQWTEENAEAMLRAFRSLYERGYVAEEYRDLSDSV